MHSCVFPTPFSSRFTNGIFALLGLIVLGHPQSAFAEREKVDGAKIDYFENHVRPLLVEHCYECHSQESGESAGGLQLDYAASTLAGGLTGPALIPGKVKQSLLVRVVRYDDPDMQMPPDGKLPDEAIAKLEHWIAIGAPDPRKGGFAPPVESPLDRDPKSHWAFQVPSRSIPPVPGSLHSGSLRTAQTPTDLGRSTSQDAIDAHAAAAAAAKSLPINPIAGDDTLIRRLTFDLTGTPPTHQEIAAFRQSNRPDKYVRLVDQLLASPSFGERFGRHWLDVARYADTLGYATAGKPRQFEGSERYRDWTIAAFASDMPYDEMIHHQLAGDRTDPENRSSNLDAMGFLTLGRRYLNKLDVTDDRIDVISRGLLGMTVSCARCHDHKFDPIPTTDYYALAGVLRSSRTIDDGPSPLMMVDADKPSDQRVMVRGQPGNRGEIAPRQFLTALRRPDEGRFKDGSGRLELAHRITADDNPLAARVMVNRLWQILIGKPLVDSPSDFGFRTQPPAVPEVLDDLALDFSEHWSIQRTVRRIVMTRIYRQSAEKSRRAIEIDPDNRLLARAIRRRRDFESLRDSMLHCGGYLDRKRGGSPVEITADFVTPRRTVYALIDRQNLPSVFRTFDFASPDTHSPGRYLTTVPQQGLYLLNDQQIYFLSNQVADRVREMVKSNSAKDRPPALVDGLFKTMLSRLPTNSERERFVSFLSSPPGPTPVMIDPRSLWSYGYASTDAKNRQPKDFVPFEIFKEGRHQASDKYPSDQPLGYASLTAQGGHPPSDSAKAVVRRLNIPFDGTLTISGQYGHRSKQGDGVQLDIWNGKKRLRSNGAKSNNSAMAPTSHRVKAGQFVDFSVTNRKESSFDSYYWRITVSLSPDSSDTPDSISIATESDKDFYGGEELPTHVISLDRLAQAAQVLFMSNEFAFVD